MMHISRLSEELILWSSQEFNFISFDDAFCTGSSIMPQKKNPDVVELGRGKTGRVYGALLTLLTILKGLPLAYNKDLQEDKEPLFDTIKTLCQTLSIYSPMLATIKINSKNMRHAVNDGYLNATALAEYLVKNGVTFRAAHEAAGKIVAFCLQKKCKLEELSLPELQQFSPLINDKVYQILSIENTVAACNVDIQSEFLSHVMKMRANQEWVLEKNNLLNNIYTKFNLPFILKEC
jgi:argininosuccinate lyase